MTDKELLKEAMKMVDDLCRAYSENSRESIMMNHLKAANWLLKEYESRKTEQAEAPAPIEPFEHMETRWDTCPKCDCDYSAGSVHRCHKQPESERIEPIDPIIFEDGIQPTMNQYTIAAIAKIHELVAKQRELIAAVTRLQEGE